MCFNEKLAISRKWWETRPRLLLITNRKQHTSCHVRWKSSTLDDFEGHWQVPVRSAGLLLAWIKTLCDLGNVQANPAYVGCCWVSCIALRCIEFVAYRYFLALVECVACSDGNPSLSFRRLRSRVPGLGRTSGCLFRDSFRCIY